MYILESSRNICLLWAAKKNHATYFDSSNLVLSAHKAEQRTPKNVNATRELNERTQFTWYVFPLASTETKNFILFIVYSFQCNYKSYSCSSFWTEWTLSGIEYNCLREQSLSTFKDIICFALDRTTNWPGLPLISVHSRINIYLCGTRELGHFDHQHHVVYVICLISYNEHELNTRPLSNSFDIPMFAGNCVTCVHETLRLTQPRAPDSATSKQDLFWQAFCGATTAKNGLTAPIIFRRSTRIIDSKILNPICLAAIQMTNSCE